MCEIMFETFGFESVYVAVQAVLTLYAQGNNDDIMPNDIFTIIQDYGLVLLLIQEMVLLTLYQFMKVLQWQSMLHDWTLQVETLLVN